jgi:signal transduction histidine kinase
MRSNKPAVPAPPVVFNRQILAEQASVARFEFADDKPLEANDANLPRNGAWAVQQNQIGSQQLQLNYAENALRNRAVTAQNEEAIKQQPMIKMKTGAGTLELSKTADKELKALPVPKPMKKADEGKEGAAQMAAAAAPAAPAAVAATPPVPAASAPADLTKAAATLKINAASTSSRPFQGVWLGRHLVLTREAVVDGTRMVQGVWLDWPALREAWLKEITDLFPDAHLEPAANVSLGTRPTDDPLRFAALPVRLVAGVIQLPPLPFWTPLRKSLAIALACVLLAAAAVGMVLHGTVALSERRADFVSAVTHELRTPLTTFRLYSEMLADGMVTDEAQRKTYLDTLTGEAGRLSHLVENVLAYARLERGSAKARAENVTIGELLDRILPRLKHRADDCGMEVRVDATDADRRTQLHIDAAAVEQILFNLVDNACKYASPRAAEPVIHVEADTSGKFAMLRVRDHGGGISRSERRRIFHPFHKSADQAAHSAPGVGLGLALCRRLATAIGGAITLDSAHKDGACFVLSLPK